ncbi:hypothetical protein [Homoserinibacter sp. YIM 151385]|uniref:hypothetical protein n=1 Tax=Homoserinibacter sp. YIM 151385 TaxID=2985506 RepID=UPI0022F04A5F|nr:hypothetical protein [Homoserinibacter sp. YIM 151385]WBU37630.1 hypothetical protein OF852_12020 [Homoserinibacter sp. YIM 151385]
MSEAQGDYQVRFEWGAAGAAQVAQDADVLVWVDQLGEQPAPEAPAGVAVVHGTIQSSAAIGAWSLARQEALGGRFRIAVVAAGEPRADGSLRFAVEDLLAAGAVIEEIAALGIDHQSPEAAAAASAHTGLRRATRHLLSASVTARAAGGIRLDLDPVDAVTVLRESAPA